MGLNCPDRPKAKGRLASVKCHARGPWRVPGGGGGSRRRTHGRNRGRFVLCEESAAAASRAGLAASTIPTLLVQGDDRLGAGARHRPAHRRRGDQRHVPHGTGDRQAVFRPVGRQTEDFARGRFGWAASADQVLPPWPSSLAFGELCGSPIWLSPPVRPSIDALCPFRTGLAHAATSAQPLQGHRSTNPPSRRRSPFWASAASANWLSALPIGRTDQFRPDVHENSCVATGYFPFRGRFGRVTEIWRNRSLPAGGALWLSYASI